MRSEVPGDRSLQIALPDVGYTSGTGIGMNGGKFGCLGQHVIKVTVTVWKNRRECDATIRRYDRIVVWLFVIARPHCLERIVGRTRPNRSGWRRQPHPLGSLVTANVCRLWENQCTRTEICLGHPPSPELVASRMK